MPEIPSTIPETDTTYPEPLTEIDPLIDKRVTFSEVLHATIQLKNVLTGLAGLAIGAGISYLFQRMNFHRILPQVITAIPFITFSFLHIGKYFPIFLDDPGGKPPIMNFTNPEARPWTRTTFDISIGMFIGTLIHSLSTRLVN